VKIQMADLITEACPRSDRKPVRQHSVLVRENLQRAPDLRPSQGVGPLPRVARMTIWPEGFHAHLMRVDFDGPAVPRMVPACRGVLSGRGPPTVNQLESLEAAST
jgi:hypothetical protein